MKSSAHSAEKSSETTSGKTSGIFAFALLTAAAVLLNVVSGAILTNALALGAADLSGLSVFSLLGHRYVSEGTGTLVIVLSVWITIAHKRVHVKQISWLALLCVAAEALLGRSAAPLSPLAGFLHAFLAEVLFALLVSIAMLSWHAWRRHAVPIPDKGWPSLRGLSNSLVGVLILQVALGAAFRHNLIGVLWHILGAFLVVVFGLAMLVIITQVPENRSLRAPVIWIASLLGVQVTLGMVLISISDPSKHPMVAMITVASHHTVGTLALGLGVMTAMLVRRSIAAPVASHAG